MTPRLPSTRCFGPDCPICYRDYEALYPDVYRQNLWDLRSRKLAKEDTVKKKSGKKKKGY